MEIIYCSMKNETQDSNSEINYLTIRLAISI